MQSFSATPVNCNEQAASVSFAETLMDKQTQRKHEDFGSWIRQHRLAHVPPLNQTQAAKKAKISRAQYIRIENGESGTKRQNIKLIAQAVGADVDEAYIRAGFTPPNEIETSDDPRRGKVITYFDELSNTTKDQALSILEALWRGEIVNANVPGKKKESKKTA